MALESGWALAGTQGADHRFTGSHEIGSGAPARMPVTQWLFDSAPQIDPSTWRLTVSLPPGKHTLTLGELEHLSETHTDRISAVLDCTGGWWSRQEWQGVRLDRLLGLPSTGGWLLVSSLTGYHRAFPLADLPHLWLATSVSSEPLSQTL